MADTDSKVTPTQQQTDKATSVNDPTHIDDSVFFTYDKSANFTLKDFNTYIQDTQNVNNPQALTNKLIPSSNPFILEIVGSGFSNNVSLEPFKIFAKLDGYYSIIPPLTDTANLGHGYAYGYVIKDDTRLWIYFKGLLTQKNWFETDDFTGVDGSAKEAIETGDSSYPYLNVAIPKLYLYFASTINFTPQTNILDDLASLNFDVTQTPYIITNLSAKRDNKFVPYAVKDQNTIQHRVDIFGYGLSNKHIMFVKSTSKLLNENTLRLPDEVLQADQSSNTIQSMKLQDLQNLEYFKEGFFLKASFTDAASTLKDYNYFSTEGSVVSSGPENSYPIDLPTYKFIINTLPVGLYFVVIYDGTTGAFSVAPNLITISAQDADLQIHDVSPTVTTLQSPQFTLNGFNFPVVSDIQDGYYSQISVYLSDQNKAPLLDPAGILQLDAGSTENDINGRGSISLVSDSQMIARFDAVSSSLIDASTVYLTIETFGVGTGKNKKQIAIQQKFLSPVITVQQMPVITFMTNGNAQPEVINPNGKAEDASKSKSLVRIDQKTGQVIAYGNTGLNELYIVGKNFGSRKDVNVLFNGNKQTIGDVFRWDNGDDPTLTAIIVLTEADSSFKGDVTIEVKNGTLSSEPFTLIEPKPYIVPKNNQNKQPNGLFIKNETTIGTSLFFDNIPYDQFSSTFQLINATNAKVASSLAVSLQNSETRETVKLKAGLSSQSATAIKFNPDLIIIPKDTPLASDGTFNITFQFYNAFNVNFSTPKIVRLQHSNGDYTNPLFIPGEIMTVVGTGFADGMRYNFNDTKWETAIDIHPLSGTTLQAFNVTVPASDSKKPSLKISNDQANVVSALNTSGKQSGNYKVGTIVVNDRYSPLLKINQRLPAGIKMYAKGPQVTITDKIDANLSIFTQVTPFLSSFRILLIIVRVLVCIIDVICALVNPFKLIVAIIALMDCIIDLLSLFPQLAVPIMILSFLQNFIGFMQTFIQLITGYVLSIVNSQLALVVAQVDQDFAALAAAEQQAFAAVKQIQDVISFLEPALQIIQIFKDLLNFAMHFPCASNQGSDQNNGCPPNNMQDLLKNMIGKDTVPANTYTAITGNITRTDGVVSVITSSETTLKANDQFMLDPGESNFPAGTKTIATIIDSTHFTYTESGLDAVSVIDETIGTLMNADQQATLATMFCQAVAMQTKTLQTMPGFNGLDNFGNPLPGGPLAPGSTSIIPNITPVLPDVAAAIDCMNILTANVENALNAGQIFITNAEQGNQLLAAYTQCAQNLLDQANQALGDVCVLAVSALNSELKVSPKGNVGPDLSDDFVKTKFAFPSTQPNDQQDAGLVIDLATIIGPSKIPSTIGTDTTTNISESTLNFGLQRDIYTPIIVQTTNKSGQRQSIDTIYFNADNSDVAGLISIGDILEIVGGTFNGLQFPILDIESIFTAVRLKVKLDITAEQKLLVGEQTIPINLSDFDVKVIAHLAGNDAVAVVPADDASLATVQIIARDHHGHELGTGLANKISVTLDSGEAVFVPIIPSSTTDVTGVIQESGTHYIANLKSNCSGTVIVSASVCGVIFQDIGYHANDPNHTITTRTKTIKIIFTPPIPKPVATKFDIHNVPQVKGTNIPN